jgi:hypothetical protein
MSGVSPIQGDLEGCEYRRNRSFSILPEKKSRPVVTSVPILAAEAHPHPCA